MNLFHFFQQPHYRLIRVTDAIEIRALFLFPFLFSGVLGEIRHKRQNFIVKLDVTDLIQFYLNLYW